MIKEQPIKTGSHSAINDTSHRLYERMLSSLKTLRLQMEDLSACKLALETGLADFSQLKAMLSEESKGRQIAEKELENERSSSQAMKQDYEKTKQILRQLVSRQDRTSIQTLYELAECVQKIQLENFEMDLDNMAWCMTFEAIDQAAIRHQDQLYRKQVKAFQKENESYNRMLEAANESLHQVQEQVDRLKKQLAFRHMD